MIHFSNMLGQVKKRMKKNREGKTIEQILNEMKNSLSDEDLERIAEEAYQYWVEQERLEGKPTFQ